MSITREWGDYVALLGLVNIFDIPVAAVSSLGEGLFIIYPSNHSQEEAYFEAHQSSFHSLQQMDSKTTDVLEELNWSMEKGKLQKIKFA